MPDPTFGQAAARCIVQLDDGSYGRLLYIYPNSRRCKVRVAGRHRNVASEAVVRVYDDRDEM
jgi:hypothetical protein